MTGIEPVVSHGGFFLMGRLPLHDGTTPRHPYLSLLVPYLTLSTTLSTALDTPIYTPI